jgi:dihydroorotase
MRTCFGDFLPLWKPGLEPGEGSFRVCVRRVLRQDGHDEFVHRGQRVVLPWWTVRTTESIKDSGEIVRSDAGSDSSIVHGQILAANLDARRQARVSFRERKTLVFACVMTDLDHVALTNWTNFIEDLSGPPPFTEAFFLPSEVALTGILIHGGRVIDPANGRDEVADVRIADGRITEVGRPLAALEGDLSFDATGLLITPGWIDAHVHLRDPGQVNKEDLNSGAAAAVAGGFTRLCCMPNTVPPLDSAKAIQDIIRRGALTGVSIHPIGTISRGRAGKQIAPLRAMSDAGAIGFSDDGDSTSSEDVMRAALRLSSELNKPIMVHCEDPELARPGSLHRGHVSAELGDPGIPDEAEESFIERDLALAEETGGWLHVLHVSTVRGVELIRDARSRGVRVTSEVMPHHLTLTHEWVAGRKRFAGEESPVATGGLDTNAKVNPPLRTEADALGLIAMLAAGEFDFIATDHAPHAPEDKTNSLESSAFGMTGLEVAIPTMTRLIDRGLLDWPSVVAWFTAKPASVLNLPGGSLTVGDIADVTVIDPRRPWVIDRSTLRTRSANTPLLGITMRGRAVMTIVAGEVRHNELS